MKYLLVFTTLLVSVSMAAIFFSSSQAAASSQCAGVKTSYLWCPGGSRDPDRMEQTGFWKFLLTAINWLTGFVAIIAVGTVVWASVMYASAGDNSSQTGQAKTLIRDVVIGLVIYSSMYAVAQYFIPGGIFS